MRPKQLSNIIPGGLAQLARAPALHAGGQRFESVILHQSTKDKEQSSKLKVQRVKIKQTSLINRLKEVLKFPTDYCRLVTGY